jgi:uncharacterized protein YegJ (DUF2314 family)
MTRFALTLIFACLSMTTVSSHRAFAAEDRAINVPSQDAEMNAAIEKARQTLPRFWAKFSNPGEGETGFALKVRIQDGANSEHFWVINIERKGDLIFGTINNDPEYVKSVSDGERIQINPDQISDWMYLHNRKIVGNETMRPLLPRMPKKEADAFRAMLETP